MSDLSASKNSSLFECVSFGLFIRDGIAPGRRWFGFGVRGFAQRGLLIFPPLFLFDLGARGPRSLSSISSIIWLECHGYPRRLIPKARGII
jgi:hypothetical protein